MPLALITGAASGSGYAIAERFILEGWDVLGLDINAEGLKRVEAELGASFTSIECDLRNLDAVMSLADIVPGFVDIDADADDDEWTAAEPDLSHGHVSTLVNCAGRLQPGTSAGYPGRRYLGTINSMLTAPALTTCMALPAMHAVGRGAVINIGSFYSLWGGAGKAGYLAAKWGLRGMTMGMGLESAAETGTGVRHVCICPPHVNSPLLNPHQVADEARIIGVTPDHRYRQLLAQMPTHELATVDDVAGMVWWWMTAPEARHITACTLDMSGGISAGFPFRTAGW